VPIGDIERSLELKEVANRGLNFFDATQRSAAQALFVNSTTFALTAA
jgi:hypothetical protein